MLNFEDTVKQTIKEIIKNVFEEDEVVESLFRYFHKTNSNMKDENTQILTDALPKILGSGSVIIEDLIIETLYSKYNLDIVWKKDYSFTDYIIELRKQTTKELVLS